MGGLSRSAMCIRVPQLAGINNGASDGDDEQPR